MRYIATVDGQEYRIDLGESGVACVDDKILAVELESIDGEFHYSLLLDRSSHEVFVERCDDLCFVILEGRRYQVRVEDERLRQANHRLRATPEDAREVQVASPMPGVVVAVLVQEGQPVTTGESLAILEAMKMENEIRAPRNGTVDRVYVAAGQSVGQGDDLILIGTCDEA